MRLTARREILVHFTKHYTGAFMNTIMILLVLQKTEIFDLLSDC
jgi:hypothetical protein